MLPSICNIVLPLSVAFYCIVALFEVSPQKLKDCPLFSGILLYIEDLKDHVVGHLIRGGMYDSSSVHPEWYCFMSYFPFFH